MCLHNVSLIFEEKVPGKVGECIFDSQSAIASRALRWPQTPGLQRNVSANKSK